MKKIYAVLGSAAVVASATAAAPVNLQGRVNLKDVVQIKAQSEKKVEVESVSDQKVIPLKAQAPMKASVEHKSVVLYEDFNNVPDGETETIGHLGDRYTDYVASHYFEPGRYIDNEYTPGSGTWEGDFVMAGKGGTVVLQCYNPQMGAAINTPLGDYSGDITVTVRARAVTPFWGADNELGYVTTGGSDLTMAACIDGYDVFSRATTDMEFYSQMSTGQLYPKEGWQEITYKFRNESANADGYLSFSTTGAIEIDWIKVTDDNTLLPAPVTRGATNFTNEGFTINWDPVRRSYNYYIDLWKVRYTADAGIDEKFDFETETLPYWLTGKQVEYAEGDGFGGSNAVVIAADGEDNGLQMVDLGAKLGSFTTKIMFQCDDLETREEPMYVMYDVLTANGWEPYGYVACDGWFTGPDYYFEVALKGEKFENLYNAVRVYGIGTNEDSKIFVDDMAIWTRRPFELDRVESEFGAVYDPDDDDYDYNYYTYTGIGTKYDPQDPGRDSSSYTFVGLDPEAEYWYRVRSHNVRDFNGGEKLHAFGVAAPTVGDPENVGAGSYTATWTDAPKADKYYVTNCSAEVIKNADAEYTLLEENFANCDGDSDISLMEPIEGSFDDYTDLKGWTSDSGMYGYRMIGCDYGGYLLSPAIYANPQRGNLLVYLDVIGMAGDYLYIQTIKGGFSGPVAFDEDGLVNGYIEIPAVEGEQIRLASYYGQNIALGGFEVVQAVEAGDVVRRFDSVQEVGKGVQSCTFNNLDGEVYAYSIQSSYSLEGETALSITSDVKTVNVKTPGSGVTNDINAIDGNVTETDRFAADGTRVSSDYKGIVLLKKSNGQVSKTIAK